MKIYLIRHGETDQNRKYCLQGHSDIELNEYGRKLARKTKEGLEDVDFNLIFTSPLKRAKETAQIIRGEREIPLIEEKRLMEIGFGDYEGLCSKEDNYTIPDKDFLFFFKKPECYVTPPGGESLTEVMERTGAFFEELIHNPEYEEKTILISTHGCALKAILANVRNTPLADFWGVGVHKNCAVTLLEVHHGRACVLEEGRIYY